MVIVSFVVAPPKRPTKRLMKSLPANSYHDNNLVPLKYSGIRDAPNGGFQHLDGVPKSKSYPRGQVRREQIHVLMILFTEQTESRC